MKDRRATISSVDHMINKTSLLPTRDSRHQQRLSHRYMRSQREKSSLSPLIPLAPEGFRLLRTKKETAQDFPYRHEAGFVLA
jgi:hypothetical protein